MVALGFGLILVVPFILGCAAMALPLARTAKVAIAVSPLLLLVLAVLGGFFWLGDVGGALIAAIATWAWLLGVGASRDVRSMQRVVTRLGRR